MKGSRTANSSVAAHIIVWAVIYLLPILMTALIFNHGLPAFAYWRYAVLVTSHLAVYYLNYFFLVDKCLFRRGVVSFIASNFLTIALLESVVLLLFRFVVTDSSLGDDVMQIMSSVPVLAGLIAGPVSSQTMVVLISVSVKSTERARREEQKRVALEKERTEAELKYLKDKLNPHFLFNALNNIYALTSIDPDKAQAAIDSLSKLLRYVLYDNDSDLVPLEDELEFTRCYIDLMALRLDPSKTRLSVDLGSAPAGSCKVAPLMIMTLIENAFKHGVSSREKSFIDVSLKFDSDAMECCVRNSLFPEDGSDKSGSGVGLENLRRRLSLIYGAEASFDVSSGDGVYCARLQIPLK